MMKFKTHLTTSLKRVLFLHQETKILNLQHNRLNRRLTQIQRFTRL